MWVRLNQNPGAPISNENCDFQGDPLWLLHGLPEQPQLVDWRRLLPLLPAHLRSIRTARWSVKIQILSNTWYFCTGIFQLSKNVKRTKEKKNKICFDFNRNYDISFLNRRQTWAIRKWKRGFPQRAKYLSALVRAITLTTACQTLAVPKQNFIEGWERLYFDWFVLISRFGLYLAEAGECQQGVVFLNSKGKTSTCRWSGRRRYLPIFFCVTIHAHVDIPHICHRRHRHVCVRKNCPV